MDQNVSNLSSKRVSVQKVLLTLFIILTTFVAGNAAERSSFIETDLTVTSIGVIEGEMVFNLKYDNAEEDKLEITLTDQEGNTLYRKLLTDKKLNKTFKMSTELETVYLTVTNVRTKTEKKFQITTHQRVVEKMLIGSVH